MNYLLPVLNHFFEKLNFHTARVHTLNSFINNFKNHLQSNEPDNRLLLSGIDVFRDRTKFTNPNLIETGYQYKLEVKNLKTEIEIILSWEYYGGLTQMYELFNSYIYNLTTDYIFLNQENIERKKLHLDEGELSKTSIKKKLKDKFKTKNILDIPSLCSWYYRENISISIWDIDISKWFALLTEVRHAVVHMQNQVSPKLFEMLLNKENERIFDTYFDKKVISNTPLLYLDPQKFDLNKTLLCEVAYFIFKSVSIDSALNPKYTKLN